ncbi:MAG: hypothetical protein DRJ03_00215 [Chloroflexi bacterium]|nr:MAG: hypothetical protein DRJ03_00215 [Chloroflexota bacterium]
MRGVANLGAELDLTDTLTQTALVQIIKEYRIKALVAKKTKERVVRFTRRRRQHLVEQRASLATTQPVAPIDTKKNSTFVDTGEKNTLAKIREAENG